MESDGLIYLLEEAVITKNIADLKWLLKKTRHVDVHRAREHKMVAFFKAVRAGNKEMMKILLKNGVSIEMKDKAGRTALHVAAETGNARLVESLIRRGANVNARNSRKETPLHRAVECDRFDAAKLLLANGARVNALDRFGHNPLHMAVDKDSVAVAELLLRHGADPNCSCRENWTPFEGCMLEEPIQEGIIKLFLEYFVRVRAKNRWGENALHYASEYCGPDVVKTILQINSKIINDRDHNKATALHHAFHWGYQRPDETTCAIAKLLVEQGVDIEAQDKTSRTALDLAVFRKNKRAVVYLLTNETISISSGALAEAFRIFNQDNDHIIMHVLLKRIAFLSSQNLYAHQENLKMIRENRSMREDYEDFGRELQSMKSTRVCENSTVTYYDLITKRRNALVRCLRCANVRIAVESGACQELCYKRLWEYLEQVEENCDRGLRRMRMIDTLRALLREIFVHLLPPELTMEICDYLTDDELEISVREMI